MADFGGKLWVSGSIKAQRTVTARMWASVDGRYWAAQPWSQERFAEELRVFHGRLYAFTIVSSTPQPSLSVYSTDGNGEWVSARNSAFSGAQGWSDVTEFQNALYAVDRQGHLFRTDGVGPNPTWESLPTSFPDSDSQMSLEVRSFGLLVSKGFPSGLFPVTIDSLWTGSRWVTAETAADDAMAPGAVDWNGVFYRPAARLWALQEKAFYDLSGSIVSVRYAGEGMAISSRPKPFVYDGRLHVAGPANEILTYENALWTSMDVQGTGACAESRPSRLPVIERGGSTYVLPCGLLRIDRGCVALHRSDSFSNGLRAGDTSAVVFSFSADVNGTDALQRLTVHNLGTAIAGRDIARMLILTRVSNAPAPEIVAELAPSDDGRSWSATLAGVAAVDAQQFYLAVDIAGNPLNGATVRFSLSPGDAVWEVNAALSPGATLSAADDIVITAAAAAPPAVINGVQIYPMPASDHVRFRYTLSADARVRLRLYDRSGTPVRDVDTPSQSAAPAAVTTLDVADLAPGVYYAVLEIDAAGADKRVMREKVIIER
jgi:hypothetical protein